MDDMTDDERALNDLSTEEFDAIFSDPDTLPTDPDALAKLMEGTPDPGTEPAPKPEPDVPADPSPEAGQAIDDETEAPILSADGKHAIPYAVLKQEREARRAAAERAQRLEQELQALKAKPTEPQSRIEEPATELDESAQAFLEEFPEVAKITTAQRAEIERLRREMQERDQRLEQVSSILEAQQAERQRAELESVQAAIDANPVLTYLRSGDADPRLWDAAVAIDQELQQRPRWAKSAHADRFAEVVKRLETDYGPVTLPSSYRPSPKPEAKPSARPPESKPAAPARAPIETLSDLAGGSSPDAGETSLEAMSSTDITSKLLAMSYEQLQKSPELLFSRL